MVGEDFAAGEGCAELCWAIFSGEAGAEAKGTAQIKSNVVGMNIRMGRR